MPPGEARILSPFCDNQATVVILTLVNGPRADDRARLEIDVGRSVVVTPRRLAVTFARAHLYRRRVVRAIDGVDRV